MTREQVRELLAQVLDPREPPASDDEVVDLDSLDQLEFMFGLEEALGFRHDVPEDIGWLTINDVTKWLEAKGELQGTQNT